MLLLMQADILWNKSSATAEKQRVNYACLSHRLAN